MVSRRTVSTRATAGHPVEETTMVHELPGSARVIGAKALDRIIAGLAGPMNLDPTIP